MEGIQVVSLIWKHFGHKFSHFLCQILLKICQSKVKKVDNPSQFRTTCIPSLFRPESEFVHLECTWLVGY